MKTILLEANPINEYTLNIIQKIGIGIGIWMIISFLGLLHEVWHRKNTQLPMLAAGGGLAAEVLALWYFPETIYLILPFTFAFQAWWIRSDTRYKRKLAESKIELPYEPATHGLFPKQLQWIIAATIAVVVYLAINSKAEEISERQAFNQQLEEQRKAEAANFANQVSQVKKTIKEESDTSKRVRKTILKELDKSNEKLAKLEAKLTEAGKTPGGKSAKTVVRTVYVDKSAIKTKEPTFAEQPSTEIKRPVVDPKQKKKGVIEFLEGLWPFSGIAPVNSNDELVYPGESPALYIDSVYVKSFPYPNVVKQPQ